MKSKWLGVLFLVVASFTHCLSQALAENLTDPSPAITWDEALACELVVVARYESHQTSAVSRVDPRGWAGTELDKEQTLTLHIDRVLKGNNVKVGEVLSVPLRHWYTIETQPVDNYRHIAPTDGIPRLCYKAQFENPGGLKPLQILNDVREDALYFFPKLAPDLTRPGQVHSLDLLAGWTKALHGEKLDVPFRLAQYIDPQLQREALEELKVSRDPAALDLLFEWLSFPTPQNLFYSRHKLFPSVAQQALLAVGDQGGDVYNRAFKHLSSMSDDWVPYAEMSDMELIESRIGEGKWAKRAAFASCAQIMAAADGERAARDFARLIKKGSPALSEISGSSLGSTNSEYALDLAFQLVESPETASIGLRALRNLLIPSSSSASKSKDWQQRQTRLREIARPRLDHVLKLPVFDASRTEAALRSDTSNELLWVRLDREALEKAF